MANVFYNTMTFNNIEVDIPTGNFKQDNIEVELFTNFRGRVYSAMILAKNEFSLMEEANIPQGFMAENDIRNFGLIFESHLSKVVLLYTPIRAKEDEESVRLFDAFHKNHGVASESLLRTNLSLKKEICCYGGLANICSFLVPIETIQG